MFKKSHYLSVLLFIAPQLFAQGTPWLPAPSHTSITFSYVYQEANELFAGETRSPLSDDLTQATKWLNLSHGLSENIALDGQIGFADSNLSLIHI